MSSFEVILIDDDTDTDVEDFQILNESNKLGVLKNLSYSSNAIFRDNCLFEKPIKRKYSNEESQLNTKMQKLSDMEMEIKRMIINNRQININNKLKDDSTIDILSDCETLSSVTDEHTVVIDNLDLMSNIRNNSDSNNSESKIIFVENNSFNKEIINPINTEFSKLFGTNDCSKHFITKENADSLLNKILNISDTKSFKIASTLESSNAESTTNGYILNDTYSEFEKMDIEKTNQDSASKLTNNNEDLIKIIETNGISLTDEITNVDKSLDSSKNIYESNKQFSKSTSCENINSTIVLDDSDNESVELIEDIICNYRDSKSENFNDPQNVNHKNDDLRYIIIDGSNVAMEHARHSGKFSCKGIEIVIEYFLKRGHNHVIAIVPQARRRTSDNSTINPHILEKLAHKGHICFTPSRIIENRAFSSYDDRYILKLASMENGVVVSNDNFRDLYRKQADWDNIIQNRVLPFMFHGDVFMPPDDPLGKKGPCLVDFLRHCQPKEPQIYNKNIKKYNYLINHSNNSFSKFMTSNPSIQFFKFQKQLQIISNQMSSEQQLENLRIFRSQDRNILPFDNHVNQMRGNFSNQFYYDNTYSSHIKNRIKRHLPRNSRYKSVSMNNKTKNFNSSVFGDCSNKLVHPHHHVNLPLVDSQNISAQTGFQKSPTISKNESIKSILNLQKTKIQSNNMINQLDYISIVDINSINNIVNGDDSRSSIDKFVLNVDLQSKIEKTNIQKNNTINELDYISVVETNSIDNILNREDSKSSIDKFVLNKDSKSRIDKFVLNEVKEDLKNSKIDINYNECDDVVIVNSIPPRKFSKK